MCWLRPTSTVTLFRQFYLVHFLSLSDIRIVMLLPPLLALLVWSLLLTLVIPSLWASRELVNYLSRPSRLLLFPVYMVPPLTSSARTSQTH
jgi:hypothetical protein